jgi:hypothetical protein
MKCMVQGAKSPVKNLVRQRCAEGFNSGVEGLNHNTRLKITPVAYILLSYFEQTLFANNYLLFKKVSLS